MQQMGTRSGLGVYIEAFDFQAPAGAIAGGGVRPGEYEPAVVLESRRNARRVR